MAAKGNYRIIIYLCPQQSIFSNNEIIKNAFVEISLKKTNELIVQVSAFEKFVTNSAKIVYEMLPASIVTRPGVRLNLLYEAQ